LDVSFGTNGLQITDFGSYEYAGAVAIQSDGKIVVAGSVYDPTTGNEDFAIARYTTAGLLDDSFDGDGKQTTDFGSYDYALGIAIQSDGKIVVAGGVYNPNGNNDFVLARYTTAGLLDTDFDGDGKQTTDFGGFDDNASAIAIQSDGKIVVVGEVYNNTTGSSDFAIARYTTTGLLDTDFDGDGLQITDFGPNEYADAIAIQSDGKIVVAGTVYNQTTNNSDFGLARYNTAGLLDITFSEDGKQTTDFGGSYDNANGVAIQSDGKIVVVGETESATTDNEDIGLARYNTNGVLDRNFDRDGKLTRYFPASDGTFYAIAVQSDGKVVVAGRAKNVSDNYDFALARYNADGSLDRNFNRSGKQTTDFFGGSDYVYGVAIQSDGKIVVAGSVYDPTTGNEDFGLARYNTNGSLDKTFSGDGKQTTDFFGSYEYARGLAIQSDGKMVVAGGVYDPNGNQDFAIARYTTAGLLDNTFSEDGKQTTDFGGSDDFARGLAIQSDGKIVVAGEIYDFNNGNEDFAIARYTTAGLLDTDFDGDGKQTTDFFGSYDNANAIGIQSDGKIVVAGGIYDFNNGNEDFAIARYTTAGLLDNTFSEDGKQTTDFGTYDYARGLAIQSDGKIVVGGQVEASASGSDDIGLARYNTDGSLDTDFDGDGKQITDFGRDNNYAHALAIRNNKLYVGGRSNGLMRLGAVAVYSLGTVLSAPPANSVTSANGSAIANEQNLAQKLKVKVLSNPSTTYFTVVIQSNSDKAVSLRMVDAVGRVVEGKGGIAANSSLRIGHSYRPGVYYAQVMQGSKMVTLKLIKQGY
jgi:uncharacterized delta-60 repeat protein